MRPLEAGGIALPQCYWQLPDPSSADPDEDLVGIGADLAPATVLHGYATGLFPMHVNLADSDDSSVLGWWSPNPRGVLPLTELRVTKSLSHSMKKFELTFDQAFVEVMSECQRPGEEGQWITQEFINTYEQLHSMGFAHSVEVWNHKGELAGGLYGIELGGLFAGESMFHRERDASKVALVALVEKLSRCPGPRLLDVQWKTDHLATLGVVEISRDQYLESLLVALENRACF